MKTKNGLKVNIESFRKKAGVSKNVIKRRLADAGDILGLRDCEVNLILVGKPEIIEMHRAYFGKNTETDVISFPMDEPDPETGNTVLGDIAVSVDAADKFIRPGRTIGDEVFLYALHGLLHLIGYDDLEPAAKRKMFALQRRITDALKKKNGSAVKK